MKTIKKFFKILFTMWIWHIIAMKIECICIKIKIGVAHVLNFSNPYFLQYDLIHSIVYWDFCLKNYQIEWNFQVSKKCFYSLEKTTFFTVFIRPNKVRRIFVDLPMLHFYIESLWLDLIGCPVVQHFGQIFWIINWLIETSFD